MTAGAIFTPCGEPIEFDIKQEHGNLLAVNVTGLNGAAIEETEFEKPLLIFGRIFLIEMKSCWGFLYNKNKIQGPISSTF